MHRFFVDDPCRVGEESVLPPTEAHHAALVLRLMPGETVELLDGQGVYAATLSMVGKHQVRAVVSARLPDREPRVRVTLFQGLAKGDKFDSIVQKCTELGVHAVQPLEMLRCVVRLDAKRTSAQCQRWQRIAREATKQCGRAWVPQIQGPIKLDDSIFAEQQLIIVPWEDAEDGSLGEVLAGKPSCIGLVIGPEGGITEDEVGRLRGLGAKIVTLGPRVLRTETAGMAALAAILALCGEME
ncbi:MAG: 16S rRNA (uracil(1498)-N(3))-methyltransferase [Clostridia bacterium]|nr:16S rRNA (uracil(1498)-N(3))-methyltransferase [Clostridia bacterium]